MRKITMFALVTLTLGAIGLATLSRTLELKPVGVAVAPRADEHPEAVVQVYGADVWGMRGRFAIHTWIVTKAANADRYTRYQVIGWRRGRGMSVVSITNDRPDGDWFGSAPVLLFDRRGAEAEHFVESIHRAALSYPFANEYVMWPGPNSNSFTEWIALEVPELGLELPAKALGKSWMIEKYASLRRG